MTFNNPSTPPAVPERRRQGLASLALGRRDLPPLAWLTLAYAAAAAFGLQWTFVEGVGAVIWPAAGVAVAGLLLGGLRLWPAIFLGRLTAMVLVTPEQPLPAILAIATSAVAASVGAVWLINRMTRFDPQLASLTDLGWLLGAGAVLGAPLSAAGGIVASVSIGASPDAIGPSALVWILGYAAGVLAFAPLILVWSPDASRRQPPIRWLHLLICLGVSTPLVLGIFLLPQGALRTWHVFPMLIWAAMAFNGRGVSALLALIATTALFGAAHGMGPFSVTMGSAARILTTQQFVLITSATMLVLATVADERRAKRNLERALVRNVELVNAAEREIAERRRAERHQALLINELNHRVKNTLATVQSMISQTLRMSPNPQAAQAALTARILALSRAHDVLNGANWEGADLADLLAAALEPFESPGASRVVHTGPRVQLPPSLALALAMAFHELATNATKYGALSVPDGEVWVEWNCLGPDGSHQLELTWRERGGPPVSPPPRSGFGSRLLTRALPHQLHGEVRLDFAPDGLRCHIIADLGEARPGSALAREPAANLA